MDELSSNNNHIATTKEKIDSILGITGGKSVDEFLDGLSLDANRIQQAIEDIDDNVKDGLSKIDEKSIEIIGDSNSQPSILQLKNMELSLKEIEDMIGLSKQIFKHVAESILATDLIDSELVHAMSVLMNTIQSNISEFVSLYKSKQNFIDKVKFSILQQEQKKELLKYKHELEMQKLKASNSDNAIDVTGDTRIYRQEEVLNILKNASY